MKNVVSWIIVIIGVLAGLYVGGWILFIQPIIMTCKAFDAGTLTAVMVAVTVLKCLFASAVGYVIVWVGFTIAGLIQLSGGKSKH